MLVRSVVPGHTMLTTVFLHQQSAFALHFLHFAASSLLSLLFFQQGSCSAAPAEVTETLKLSKPQDWLVIFYCLT